MSRPNKPASEHTETDNELFVRLITSNYDNLRRYIYTLLPNEEDTKDVLQEVCLALSRKIGEYDQSRPFLPWACRFAYLKVLKHRERQPRRTIQLPDEVLELIAVERETEEPVLAERLAALHKCLEKLGDRDRRLIHARYIERIATDEIVSATYVL